MSEISAQTKHACPACGAQAEWDPAKQKLVCPFCGTESPYQIDREVGQAAEHDLEAALKALPADEQAWMSHAAERPLHELQRRHGIRGAARRTELRVLWIAGARAL